MYRFCGCCECVPDSGKSGSKYLLSILAGSPNKPSKNLLFSTFGIITGSVFDLDKEDLIFLFSSLSPIFPPLQYTEDINFSL